MTWLVFVHLLASCNHASLCSVWYRSEESLFHQNAIKVAYTFNSKSFLFLCVSNIKHFVQVCCRILAVRDSVAVTQNITEITVKNSGFQPFCRRGSLSLHPTPLRTPSLFQRFFSIIEKLDLVWTWAMCAALCTVHRIATEHTIAFNSKHWHFLAKKYFLQIVDEQTVIYF